jgi:hypothetical protein
VKTVGEDSTKYKSKDRKEEIKGDKERREGTKKR